MAEKSTDSKLKLVFSDEISEEKRDSGNADDDDPGFSLDKLNLGPKKKLLVICFGGLLVHRMHLKYKSTVQGLRHDFAYGPFLVFKRPFCTEFLSFCFQRFEVAVWASSKQYNVDTILTNIAGGMSHKFLFVWGQEKCTDSEFGCLERDTKPLFLKRLKDVWEHKRYKGRYDASNTLLIDDEPHSALLNPPNTGIFPHTFMKRNNVNTFLAPNGELRKYLEGLADAEDVPSYVKDHQIGQAAITPAHPDWSYYGKIVRRFRKNDKKEDTAEAEGSK